MEIINKQYIDVKCIPAKQPIGTMYVAVMDSADLVNISFVDVRRLRENSDNREVEDYIGIQRQLNTGREKELAQYVNLVDATFPNSIILAISSEHAIYDENSQTLKILDDGKVAKVLDGQHRIAGLQHFKLETGFDCIVTIYVDMDIEDQAIVFSTINSEQKPVSNSLAADLYAFAKTRSPQKTAHNIVRALNNVVDGPFYRKIKILGTAMHKDLETITQDTFVKSIIKYISSNPQLDRDFYKRNSKKNLELISGKDTEKYFLRNLFIADHNDIKIAQIIYNYFYAVRERWPNAWNNVTENMILNRSTGFIALMRFFKDAYLYSLEDNPIITKEQFSNIFDSINIEESDFNKDKYVPGSTGQSQLYADFINKSSIFNPNNSSIEG